MNRRKFLKNSGFGLIGFLLAIFTKPIEAKDKQSCQKEEVPPCLNPTRIETIDNNWPNWYVFDKGISQEKQEKMLKALRKELKNHTCQKDDRLFFANGEWYAYCNTTQNYEKIDFPLRII